MSALFLRPVASYPVRCSAPAFFARPAFPAVHDIAPLFSALEDSFAQLEQAHRQARKHFKRPFNPKFDVKEVQGAYSVEGELPGFDAKDISIEFLDDGHTLQIKGKTVHESRQQNSLEGAQSEAPKAVEAVPAAEQPANTSETSSVKSYHATVEDEVEEGSKQPANTSAVAEQPQPAQEESVAESSTQAAEQRQQQEQPDTKHWIKERYTGSFTRSFQFPSKVDQEAVKASLKDGILAITLPFARKPESRRIQIE